MEDPIQFLIFAGRAKRGLTTGPSSAAPRALGALWFSFDREASRKERSMPVEYMDFEKARNERGLRMVVVTGVPSPWGEAAKGILHLKQIPWKAVRLDASNDAMADWTQDRSGPVAIYNDEKPRPGWAEILLLAERLAPQPALLPATPEDRARAFGLAHEICGEDGLGWVRRLQGVHAGLNGGPGFPPPVAQYLADKYGYRAEDASRYAERVSDLLGLLARQLHAQKELGSPFFFGDSVSAVDIYSATFMALFKPLPPEQCPMIDALRPGFESMDEITAKALDPILVEHRDSIYDDFLELPMTL
jgi:glutathione S-transferase